MRQLSSAVAVPRLELMLERHAGAPASQSRILEGDLLRFGSHASNDVVLNDPLVSRFHCQLARTDSRWTIADTGSLNGTFVQGVRVRYAGAMRPLRCTSEPLLPPRTEPPDSIPRTRA
jgi:pSer/pThr/pTyr-binding forkhead associated (FHA) protein